MAEYIEREALVHHFMTTRQYLTKDLVMDAAYAVSKFPAAIGLWQKPLSRTPMDFPGTAKERRAKKIRGVPHTEEHKRKISDGLKKYYSEHEVWNKGARMDGE